MLKRGFAHVEASGQSPPPQTHPHTPVSDNWAFPTVSDLPEEGCDLIYHSLSEDAPGLDWRLWRLSQASEKCSSSSFFQVPVHAFLLFMERKSQGLPTRS